MAKLKISTFAHGVHVPDMKYLSKDKPIENMPAPERVYISLQQHIGKPANCLVAVGDVVDKGQLIGEANGFISANVYSSVSGVVEKIVPITTHAGKSDYVVIKNDGEERLHKLADIDKTDAKAIAERVKEAGIVGMGGAGFPTYVKITPKEKIDIVLINGAECEPYLTCDYRVMLEETDKLVKGARYMSKALGGAAIYFGIEENKPEAIDLLSAYEDVNVVPLKKKYPQGSEKQLIFACTGRKVGVGKLPASTGVCVLNVQSTLQTYVAVEENEGLYERVMTVTGKGVKEPKNLRVKNGTPYKEIIEYCGGFNENARKLIAGGPMMGRVLSSDAGYTRKTDSALLVLAEGDANELEPTACINCGRCYRACPMHLMPMYIDLYTHTGDYKKADEYGASNCFECGTCAYVCPAKRDLVGSVQLCKKKLRELKG